MKSADVAEILSAFVDEEHTALERQEADEHLRGCQPCRDQVASMRRLKHAVARLVSREDPPGSVRARVESLRFATAKPLLPRRTVWLSCAAILIGALLALALTRTLQAPDARLAEALVDDHVRSSAEATPAEVSSGDAVEVARFFVGRVPFAPLAPRLPGSRLVGGRVCQIEGRWAELLFYTCGEKRVSIFVLDRTLDDGRCRESRGHAVCSRRVGNLAIVAVGQLPGDELRRLVDEASL